MNKILLAAACLLAGPAPGAANHLNDFGIRADAAEIRRAVSGKTCFGPNGSVLSFGDSTPDSPGTFTRVGLAPGTYQIGYGTLLVKRGKDLHSHVVVVSLQGGQFHLGGQVYQC